jgi:lipoate-protein ligase B
MAAPARPLKVYSLGRTRYSDVQSLQQRLQAERREWHGADALLLTEHEPVFTLGRSHPVPDLKVAPERVAAEGIPIVQTERGGDITYHGPGQLVAYGIIDLKAWGMGAVDYVTGLEDAVIRVLRHWGIRGRRVDGARGAWVDGRKIASVGINVRRWVTMHGVALNVEPEMRHFDLINPCGMPDAEMTSMAIELGHPVGVPEVEEAFTAEFAGVFACAPITVCMPEIVLAAP